jgi:hypothetical protein
MFRIKDKNMSKIEEEGFLSDEAENGKTDIYKKYADFFNFAKDVNKLCMKLLTSLKTDWGNDHKLIVHTLFLRIVENFQAVYLLLERGMMPQAKVLTRAMLETLFILVALQKKPELLKLYLVDQHEVAHKKALKAALKFKSKPLKEATKKNGIETLYLQKKAELKNKELTPLSPIEWSENADLGDFYNLYYVTYSNSTHSNPSALDDHVDGNPNELNLSTGPSDRDLYDVLKCGIHILIHAANSTELVNGNDISKELEGYVARYGEFDKKYI